MSHCKNKCSESSSQKIRIVAVDRLSDLSSLCFSRVLTTSSSIVKSSDPRTASGTALRSQATNLNDNIACQNNPNFLTVPLLCTARPWLPIGNMACHYLFRSSITADPWRRAVSTSEGAPQDPLYHSVIGMRSTWVVITVKRVPPSIHPFLKKRNKRITRFLHVWY